MTENEIEKKIALPAPAGDAGGIAAEAVSQLTDYQNRRVNDNANVISGFERGWSLSEEDAAEAIKKAGTGLETMVMGDIPHLRERLQQLGLDTAQLDAKAKELQKVVDAAKPVQEAILKGDMTALQKLVAQTKPEDLAKTIELIQKHFESTGIGLNIELSNGNLIISGTGADRAVVISKDKTDVIGITNGRYDFNAQFVRENPTTELSQVTRQALTDWAMPPVQKLPPEQWRLPDQILPYPNPRFELHDYMNRSK